MQINHPCVYIVIPSYEPDERLLGLLDNLTKNNINRIIVVNDGSSPKYDTFFSSAKDKYNCTVLVHTENKGKGRALKDAFEYIINNDINCIGCVTADSDGQHTVTDIIKIMQFLTERSNSLILGVRNFNVDNVPAKSYYGNNYTRKIFYFLYGIKISDTQTGLRGIPFAFMKELLNVSGERFEFETNMIVEAKNKFPIVEVPIETVYDSKENHQTHFKPIKDSFRIYSIFLKRIGGFVLSSVSSSLLDLSFFTLFVHLFRERYAAYIIISTLIARVISATYNYSINQYFVFKSKEKYIISFPKYLLLAICIMISSGLLVTAGRKIFPFVPEFLIKLPIDIGLFIVSYSVQRSCVFKS